MSTCCASRVYHNSKQFIIVRTLIVFLDRLITCVYTDTLIVILQERFFLDILKFFLKNFKNYSFLFTFFLFCNTNLLRNRETPTHLHIVFMLTRTGSRRNTTAVVLFHGSTTVSYTAVVSIVVDSIHNDTISLDTLEVIVVIIVVVILKRLSFRRVHKSIQI